jgi:hypothetical protein
VYKLALVENYPAPKSKADPGFFFFVSISQCSGRIWLNSPDRIGGNVPGPLWVLTLKKTPGQAIMSSVTWLGLPLKNVGGWDQKGWLGLRWNCTQKNLFYLALPIGTILETVLEIIDYVNFLGSNRKSN